MRTGHTKEPPAMREGDGRVGYVCVSVGVCVDGGPKRQPKTAKSKDI